VNTVAAALPLGQTAWVRTPAELRARLPAGTTVLDTRGWWDYHVRGHVPGAVRVQWWRYRDGLLRTGRLPIDLDALAAELAKLGVDANRPVVVVGNARAGWGEEGRVSWMLHYLGHPDVTILDGGWPAWVRAGGPRSRRPARAGPGHFAARPVAAARAAAADVARAAELNAVLLDVRSDAEWNGARRYFASRGGRIPGAVHLAWRDLLDGEGRVDRSPAAYDRLRRLGVTPERPVIAYCVAGVRSGEAFVALKALGFRDVRNYEGSWWEWSADPRRPVER
jgi:thiosulfate/3-mercaptopyruvate sulfurtransferase